MSAPEPQTYEPRSPPPFRERVYALAGHSTFREPAGGITSDLKPIPSDHMIAAALSFGRTGPDDVGPDIAFDIALRRPGHYRKVCEWAGRTMMSTHRGMSGNDFRTLKRWRPHVAVAVMSAYNAVVQGWHPPSDPPAGLSKDDWGVMLLTACLLLERKAEDALELAARRARQAA